MEAAETDNVEESRLGTRSQNVQWEDTVASSRDKLSTMRLAGLDIL